MDSELWALHVGEINVMVIWKGVVAEEVFAVVVVFALVVLTLRILSKTNITRFGQIFKWVSFVWLLWVFVFFSCNSMHTVCYLRSHFKQMCFAFNSLLLFLPMKVTF